eukprot:Nk52_evm5s554 gene=Nk52_evmTU5s554
MNLPILLLSLLFLFFFGSGLADGSQHSHHNGKAALAISSADIKEYIRSLDNSMAEIDPSSCVDVPVSVSNLTHSSHPRCAECDQYATCNVVNGFPSCQCLKGFQDVNVDGTQGHKCVSVAKCTKNEDCDINASCQEEVCRCKVAYFGNGGIGNCMSMRSIVYSSSYKQLCPMTYAPYPEEGNNEIRCCCPPGYKRGSSFKEFEEIQTVFGTRCVKEQLREAVLNEVNRRSTGCSSDDYKIPFIVSTAVAGTVILLLVGLLIYHCSQERRSSHRAEMYGQLIEKTEDIREDISDIPESPEKKSTKTMHQKRFSDVSLTSDGSEGSYLCLESEIDKLSTNRPVSPSQNPNRQEEEPLPLSIPRRRIS